MHFSSTTIKLMIVSIRKHDDYTHQYNGTVLHTAAVLNKLPINSDEPYIANGNQHYYLHEGYTMV